MCRLDVHDAKTNQRVAMTVCEMSTDEVLKVASASEQGIYKSSWETYKDDRGYSRKRKVITKELNKGAFWVERTGEMVKKTIIRRALKRVKEVLPELKETIYAFEQEDYIKQPEQVAEQGNPDMEIPVISENVNLKKLTAEQKADCKEVLEMFVANPKLAEDKVTEIIEMFKNGADRQTVINEEYASIINLMKSKTKWAQIKEYFDE